MKIADVEVISFRIPTRQQELDDIARFVKFAQRRKAAQRSAERDLT